MRVHGLLMGTEGAVCSDCVPCVPSVPVLRKGWDCGNGGKLGLYALAVHGIWGSQKSVYDGRAMATWLPVGRHVAQHALTSKKWVSTWLNMYLIRRPWAQRHQHADLGRMPLAPLRHLA